jgi:hypothetical protein
MKTARWVALALAASVPLALGLAGPVGAAGPNTGGAFGVQVTVLGQSVVPPTLVVNFPPGGQRGVVNISRAGVSAGVLTVSSSGDNNGTVASSAQTLGASNANVVPVAASALTSACASSPAGTSGTASVANGTTPVGSLALSPPPNTSVPLLIGSLTVNEQQTSSNAIRVRTLHPATPVADVVLAESDCGVGIIGAATAAAARATVTNPTLAG